jgi:hypothetical protein
MDIHRSDCLKVVRTLTIQCTDSAALLALGQVCITPVDQVQHVSKYLTSVELDVSCSRPRKY